MTSGQDGLLFLRRNRKTPVWHEVIQAQSSKLQHFSQQFENGIGDFIRLFWCLNQFIQYLKHPPLITSRIPEYCLKHSKTIVLITYYQSSRTIIVGLCNRSSSLFPAGKEASNACVYPNATCCLLGTMPPIPLERRILFCGCAFFERFFVTPKATAFCLWLFVPTRQTKDIQSPFTRLPPQCIMRISCFRQTPK